VPAFVSRHVKKSLVESSPVALKRSEACDSTHSTRVWYVSGSRVRHASHAPGLVTLGLWLG
jgi:hypothetical protein